MTDGRNRKRDKGNSEVTRREFLKFTGVVVVGAGAGVGIAACGGSDGNDGAADSGVDSAIVAIPVSEGYLVVDTKKCQGCVSCMIACSLVHEGRASLSLSRIQILQDSFEKWPDDVSIEQCRQCEEPACLQECPTGALFADTEHGNVRRVNRNECIGCGACVEACPYTPSRPMVAPDEERDGKNTSRKCDLCVHAPYLCDEDGNDVAGGPGGMQACVAMCPVDAIAFTAEMPEQQGDDGYLVNLRDENWGNLFFPTD